MRQELLNDLIKKTKQELELRKPSWQVAKAYAFGLKIIERYFFAKNERYYNQELIAKFSTENEHQHENGFIEVHAYNYRKLAVKALGAVFEKGTLKHMRRLDVRRTKFILSEKYEDLLDDYAVYLEKEGYRIRTIESLVRNGRRFMHFVETKAHVELLELNYVSMKVLIVCMIENCHKRSVTGTFVSLRNFLKYLYESGSTSVDLCRTIPSYGRSEVKVIEPLTAEDELNILSLIDRGTIQGKRDYAIILLGMRTGLRSIDVVNLKLEDIDWNKKVINIVQEKTYKPLSLPLFSDAGNAIADYILNARGESEYQNVFLGIKSPYAPLRNCYNIAALYFKKAGVRQNPENSKGYHTFRHTLAIKMLSEEVPLTVISNTLGHASVESSRPYLATNAKSMKMCALDFKGIELDGEVTV